MSLSKIYKLNQDQLESAQEIIAHEGWDSLLKIIEVHVEDLEAQIHKINPDIKDCGTILLIERSKAAGARTLLSRIKALKGTKKP